MKQFLVAYIYQPGVGEKYWFKFHWFSAMSIPIKSSQFALKVANAVIQDCKNCGWTDSVRKLKITLEPRKESCLSSYDHELNWIELYGRRGQNVGTLLHELAHVMDETHGDEFQSWFGRLMSAWTAEVEISPEFSEWKRYGC